MKANLTQREPAMRKQWAKENIYKKILDSRENCPLYILHDGPPYANGDIHMGHVINKVLKDMVVKYKTMTGFKAPYIPGWDCHGLPIESKVVTELGDEAQKLSKLEIRKRCMKYASKYVKIQSRQFQDLGVFGDFDNPYLTFKPQYEAGILEVFAELVGKGLVYKQLRPIHWSIGCQTALAEAELEYQDIPSPSIFVNFEVTKESIEKLITLGLVGKDEAKTARVCFMIWTTTPWTLAANLAVAVNPALEYVSIRYEFKGQKFISIVAAKRVAEIAKTCSLEDKIKVGKTLVLGSDLEKLRYKHPFVESNPTDKDAYYVLLADYVTTEDGTGLVHTAPGHGIEDYISGMKYGLAVYSPVKNDGCYDDTVPAWLIGKNVLEVEKEVNAKLDNLGLLLSNKQFTHSYPHCWRSKTPVIFRATEQWFISVDKKLPATGKSLRQMSLESVARVKWIPAWGQKRIEGMLESRPDWCISRQRSWGLPIPVFINSQGRPLLTKESVLRVAKHIGKKGSDSWFTDSPKDILGDDFKLPDGFSCSDPQKNTPSSDSTSSESQKKNSPSDDYPSSDPQKNTPSDDSTCSNPQKNTPSDDSKLPNAFSCSDPQKKNTPSDDSTCSDLQKKNTPSDDSTCSDPQKKDTLGDDFKLPDGFSWSDLQKKDIPGDDFKLPDGFSWTDLQKEDIPGDDFKLPDGFSWSDLQKEENIFDVWFESGCSWYSVAQKAGLPIPVDLYLEGSDQHRGWFQLSLLPGLGAIEKEPFKTVLTHGFTVDEKGMKQSKSLGNYVNAQVEVEKYGADILRLWVASVNYQEDMRCTDELIGRTQDAYRKIRNTLRYLLGNLDDFDPAKNSVKYKDMFEVDKWAMQQLQKLIVEVADAYENFAFHKVFTALYNFCVVEMSSIYMDVMKDRMYCDTADSLSRRSGQTTMYRILDALIKMLAPILVHTAEEAWAVMNSSLAARRSSPARQEGDDKVESIHIAMMPKVDESIDYKGEEEKWHKLMTLRDDILRVLEGLRKDKIINSNQEASVTIHCAGREEFAGLEKFTAEKIAALCIVSEVKILNDGNGQRIVTAEKSRHPKCQRCWNWWESVGKNAEHPDLCKRCVEAIK
jgi:isoleucyl-tRNA synthetase